MADLSGFIRSKLDQFRQQVTGNIANTLTHLNPVQAGAQVGKSIGQAIDHVNRPYLYTPPTAQQQANVAAFRAQQPQGWQSLTAVPEIRSGAQGLANYYNQNVITPTKQSINSFKSGDILGGALSGVQAYAGGAFPAINMTTGGITGGLTALRTGQNPQQIAAAALKGTQQPGSISQGLGITNPWAAIGTDLLLARNPKNIPADLKAISQSPTTLKALGRAGQFLLNANPGKEAIKDLPFGMSLKSVSPRAFKIHPEDRDVIVNIVGKIQAGMKLNPDEGHTLQLLADHYLGQKYSVGSTKKIAQTLNYFLAKQEGGIPGALPKPAYLVESKTQPSIAGKKSPVSPLETTPTELPNINTARFSEDATQTAPRLGQTPLQPATKPAGLFEQGTGKQGPLVESITNKPGLTKEDKEAFADFVNSRRAIETEKLITKKEFQDLDSKGTDAFFELQEGSKNGRYADVRNYLNTKFSQANKEAGIELNYQEDYLPQVWNNTPEQIAQVFGRRLTTKAGFTMEKVVDDYRTGIQAGLSPRFTKLSDLLTDYESRVNKAVSDRKLLNYLTKNQLIMPYESAPSDWVTLNPDRFPKIRSTIAGMEVKNNGPFKAPKELASMINNYLFNPKADGSTLQKGLAMFADYTSSVKNKVLSFGVPFTAINAHGMNILARHTVFGQGGNMITRFLKGTNYLVNQKASGNAIGRIIPDLPQAIKHGLTIGVEERKSILEGAGLRGKFGNAWNKAFEEALFDKMLPALKYDSYKALVKDFSKTMPVDQAEKEAAKIANNVYGGINWEQIGRSKDVQNFLRAIVLAPDWAESTVRLGKNFATSLKSNTPQAAKYRNMMAGAFTAYVGANIANKLSSGHFMWENEPGHTFEVEAGYTDDGQKRYVRPFGTAMDMFRLPYDAVLGLAKGDPSTLARTFTNRISIPAGAAGHLVVNTDYRGNPIYGKDKYGNPIDPGQAAAGIAGEASNLAGVPSFLKQGLDTATGKQGVEQGLTQAFELPVRYTGGAYSKGQKSVQGVAKAGGLKGKELYDINQQTKGVTFSPNQLDLLEEGGIQLLPDILQGKQQRSVLNKVKDIQDQMVDGSISKEEGTRQINDLIKTVSSQPQKQSKSGLIPEAQAAGETPSLRAKFDEDLARTRVQVTGQTQQANGKLFYQDEEGSVRSVQLDRKLTEPTLTGQSALDKELLSTFSSEITKKINDIEQLYQLGQVSANDAEKAITQLTQYQKSIKAKYAKPKKIKLPKIKAAKIPKVKSVKIKPVKVKPVKIKFGKLKSPRVKIKTSR